MDKIMTGISDFDKTIGGFLSGKTVLVTGNTGTDKTIFRLQFAS